MKGVMNRRQMPEVYHQTRCLSAHFLLKSTSAELRTTETKHAQVLVLLTGTGAECLLTNRCRLETHIFVVLVKLFQIFNPPWITYHVKSGNDLKYEIAKTLSFVSSDLSVFNEQIIRTSFLT